MAWSSQWLGEERAACQSHGSWCTRCFQTEAIPQRRERLRVPLAESSSDQGAAARLLLCGGAAVTRNQAKAKIAKNDLIQDLKAAPSVLQATLLIEPGFPVGTFSPTRCSKKSALCCVLCCALCCVLCVLWFWGILKQEARSKASKARKQESKASKASSEGEARREKLGGREELGGRSLEGGARRKSLGIRGRS